MAVPAGGPRPSLVGVSSRSRRGGDGEVPGDVFGSVHDEEIGPRPLAGGVASVHDQPVVELGSKALGLGHNYVGCEHLLLGLLATEDGTAGQVLRRMGLELRTTRRAVVTTLSGFIHTQQSSSFATTSEATLEQILLRLDAIEQRLRG
jgi:ATPases with chaperone activity, ATP-binding subunit